MALSRCPSGGCPRTHTWRHLGRLQVIWAASRRTPRVGHCLYECCPQEFLQRWYSCYPPVRPALTLGILSTSPPAQQKDPRRGCSKCPWRHSYTVLSAAWRPLLDAVVSYTMPADYSTTAATSTAPRTSSSGAAGSASTTGTDTVHAACFRRAPVVENGRLAQEDRAVLAWAFAHDGSRP